MQITKMKRTIITLSLAILTGVLALAVTTEPDSMYVHFTGVNGDSIAIYAIDDIDSIVYSSTFNIPWSGTGPTDIDGNTYGAVEIGDQIWMSENLKVTKYPNGDSIPNVIDNSSWGSLTDDNTADAYCYYDNDAGIGYGAMYTYAGAIADDWTKDNKDNQGVCPDGWHLPSSAEWTTLETYLTNNGHSGAEGLALRSVSGWLSRGYEGTDDYGFSALPVGARVHTSGTFFEPGEATYFWGSEFNDSKAYCYALYYTSGSLKTMVDEKSYGYSVRCLKD